MMAAALSAGRNQSWDTDAVKVPHTMIGMRLSDIPGARVLNSVVMKLIEPTVVETASRIRVNA